MPKTAKTAKTAKTKKPTKSTKSTKSKAAKAKTYGEDKKTWAEKMTAEMNRLTTKKSKVEKETAGAKGAAGRPSKEKAEAMDLAAAKALGSRPGKMRENAIAAWRAIATKAHLRKHWVVKILGPIL